MTDTTVNSIITSVLDYIESTNPTFLRGVDRSTLELKFQEAFDKVIPGIVALGTTEPDYESIYLRLSQELQSDSVWRDTVPSATGARLLSNISSGLAYSIFGVERALQESSLVSAFSDNSVYAGARQLGVRPQRNLPATVVVSLTRPDTNGLITIPAYTQFTIGDFRFFNRTNLLFNEFDLTIVATLVQGELLTLDAVAEGIPFEKLEFGSENNLISDQDVYVVVDNVEWTRRVNEGPFNFGKNELCFYESTLPNGNVEILFGNKAFGAIPSTGANITVTWAECEGSAANNSNVGLQVNLDSTASLGVNITGITSGPIQYGEDAKDAQFYRVMAPYIRASNQRAVRRGDFRSVATSYPDVADAYFRGQAELNPGRRNWMNIIGATILTKSGTVWTNAQWNTFVDWMKSNKSIDNLEYLRMDPTPVNITISADVYCRQNTDLEAVRNYLLQRGSDLFAPKLGTLGYSVYRTDVDAFLDGDDEYKEMIEYSKNVTPVGDTVLTSLDQWVNVTAINLTMYYTTRGGYMGRLDINPPSAP